MHRWPQILPGGKAVLFTSRPSSSAYDGANIEVASLADHRRKTLERGGTFGRYLPASNGTGHLVFINKGTLFAVPFDLEKLEVRGAPTPVLNDVGYSAQAGFAQFDFSRSGTLVYRNGGGASGLVTVQWLDGAGKKVYAFDKKAAYFSVPVPAGQDGKLWKFQNSTGQRLLMTVPPCLARNERELLLPREVVERDAAKK